MIMADVTRCTEFLESSFLSELLLEKGLTDISYNGEALYYSSNRGGRKKWEKSITPNEIGDFLRQIANFSEQQFSYMRPIMDVSFSRYRLNATYASITRVKDEKSYSFSLRIATEGSAVEENPAFFPEESEALLLNALNKRETIVIAGETGSGKTELQKYLLMRMKPNTRVIVIDNVQELELCRGNEDIDLTSWHVDEKSQEANYSALIRNALRNNPDYIVLAEARGKEMLEAIHCAMSGHPLIITLHASSLSSIPSRIARLAMQASDSQRYDDLMSDIRASFSTFVYLKKTEERGRVRRYIDQIAAYQGPRRALRVLFKKKANHPNPILEDPACSELS